MTRREAIPPVRQGGGWGGGGQEREDMMLSAVDIQGPLSWRPVRDTSGPVPLLSRCQPDSPKGKGGLLAHPV